MIKDATFPVPSVGEVYELIARIFHVLGATVALSIHALMRHIISQDKTL